MKRFVGILVTFSVVLISGQVVLAPLVRTVVRTSTSIQGSTNTASVTRTQPSLKIIAPRVEHSLSSSDSYSISSTEWDLFTHIVACEASPEWGYAGALDVATVIMNRLPYWGGTITKVVSAYDSKTDVYQFSTFPIWRTSTPQDYELLACRDALNGKRSLPSSVLFFCTPPSYKNSNFFQSLTVVASRNGHMFMK